MALIECSNCGNKISQFAQACPKCGAAKIDESLTERKEQPSDSASREKLVIPVFSEQQTQPHDSEKSESSQPIKKSKAKWVIAISSIALVLIVVPLYTAGFFDKTPEITTDSYPSDRSSSGSQNDISSDNENIDNNEEQNEQEYYEPEEEPEDEHEFSAQEIESNLGDFIDVTYDYKQKLITGLHDIQVVVQNNSDYSMKSVRVEVQYQRINNKVFDREYLQFNAIGPFSTMTLYAPNKSEGSFIKCVLLEGEVSNN